MKKSLLALGIVSLLGVGTFTVNASASDQGGETLQSVYQDENKYNEGINLKNRNNGCRNLSEEEQELLEKGYNELTDVEKEIFNNYRNQGRRNLSEEQLNEFYQIQDKVHKYMDEDFKNQVKERREFRQNNQGQGKGRGQGKGNCR